MSGFLENLAMRALADDRPGTPVPTREAVIAESQTETAAIDAAPVVDSIPSRTGSAAPPPTVAPAPPPIAVAPPSTVMREAGIPTAAPAAPAFAPAPAPLLQPPVGVAVAPSMPWAQPAGPAVVHAPRVRLTDTLKPRDGGAVPEVVPRLDAMQSTPAEVSPPRVEVSRDLPSLQPSPVEPRVVVDSVEDVTVSPPEIRTEPQTTRVARIRERPTPTPAYPTPLPRADAIQAEVAALIEPQPSHQSTASTPPPSSRPVRVSIGSIEVRISGTGSAPIAPQEAAPAVAQTIEGFDGFDQIRNYTYWGSR